MTKTEAYRKDVSDKAKEINALKSQLAAEKDAFQKLVDQNTSYREALAAERERLEAKWKASMVDVTTALQNYEKQLAAAQAAMKQIENAIEKHTDGDEPAILVLERIDGILGNLDYVDALDAAIAAARQPLVDALADTNCLLMSVSGDMYEQAMAQVMENGAALAKVKK